MAGSTRKNRSNQGREKLVRARRPKLGSGAAEKAASAVERRKRRNAEALAAATAATGVRRSSR